MASIPLLLLLLHLSTPSSVRSLPSATNDAVPDPCLGNTDNNYDSSSSSWSCPVNCFRADPVCGADGVTYWCGCEEARCVGARVAKLGFCKVGDNGAAAQALLIIHIVWLIVLGFSVLLGLF